MDINGGEINETGSERYKEQGGACREKDCHCSDTRKGLDTQLITTGYDMKSCETYGTVQFGVSSQLCD